MDFSKCESKTPEEFNKKVEEHMQDCLTYRVSPMRMIKRLKRGNMPLEKVTAYYVLIQELIKKQQKTEGAGPHLQKLATSADEALALYPALRTETVNEDNNS